MTPIIDTTALIVVALVALGLALALISADGESPISRSLALASALIGISIELDLVLPLQWQLAPEHTGWFAIPEGLAIIALQETILRVRRTVPSRGLDTRYGDGVLRFGQLVAVVYPVLAILYPERRAHEFFGAFGQSGALMRSGFWLFAGPLLFACLPGFVASALLLRRRPDPAIRQRAIAMNASIPFFLGSFVVPIEYVAVTIALGEMCFLIGIVRYHVIQGTRAQFLSRFLSPQVAELVRDRGLERAIRDDLLEITVVCCDLRGFTAYARAQPSSRVIEVLREYYEAVGKIVAEYAGTIKDFAGDGILMLVGAPLPRADHARAGLDLARRIRAVVGECAQAWSTEAQRIGIGLGVASGAVTVGVISSGLRLEYTAVGSAVNLASRLCEQAADGEILVDQRSIELAGEAHGSVQARLPRALKGFGEAVPSYALA